MSVVLGYDESPGAARALQVALEVAAAFGEPLVLVYGAAAPGSTGEEYRAHREAVRQAGRSALAHAVAGGRRGGGAVDGGGGRREARAGAARRGPSPRRPRRHRRHLGRQPDPRRPAGLHPAQAPAPVSGTGVVRTDRGRSARNEADTIDQLCRECGYFRCDYAQDLSD